MSVEHTVSIKIFENSCFLLSLFNTATTKDCWEISLSVVRNTRYLNLKCMTSTSWLKFILFFTDCGIAELDVAPLVVHGWITDSTKFPWHAVLFLLEEGRWSFVCGGTLITEVIILTGKYTRCKKQIFHKFF